MVTVRVGVAGPVGGGAEPEAPLDEFIPFPQAPVGLSSFANTRQAFYYFYLDRPLRIDRITVGISRSVAGPMNFRAALYSYPANVKVAEGYRSETTTGPKNVARSVTFSEIVLPRGGYWLGLRSYDSNTSFAVVSVGSGSVPALKEVAYTGTIIDAPDASCPLPAQVPDRATLDGTYMPYLVYVRLGRIFGSY